MKNIIEISSPFLQMSLAIKPKRSDLTIHRLDIVNSRFVSNSIDLDLTVDFTMSYQEKDYHGQMSISVIGDQPTIYEFDAYYDSASESKLTDRMIDIVTTGYHLDLNADLVVTVA